MKALKQYLAALVALLDSLAILDVKGIVNLLPEGWAVWVAGVPTAAAVILHLVQGFKASLDKVEEDEAKELR